MIFDYFYAEQAESYSFYRIPKLLFTEDVFAELSAEAKILYGLIMDRISLSRENGWIDENGHVYVYYTVSNVEKALNCCKNTACKLLKELEDFGLIERKKQGLCKPAIIYVKNFVQAQKKDFRSTNISTSGGADSEIQEYQKTESINTKNINNEFINTNPILSGEPVDNFVLDKDMDERNAYFEYLNDQLEIAALLQRNPFDGETINAIRDLILDVVCSKRKTIRIAGDDKPVNVVKSQFLKLNYSHIEYVLMCLKQNGTKVRNIKQYLLATLYNAPFTMESYYQAWVNNDMAEGRI